MKKFTLSWLMLALFIIPGSGVRAADVTITVTGRVIARPCTIGTPNVDVSLGDIRTETLAKRGSVTPWQALTLNLTDCPDGTNQVSATFTGTSDVTGYYFRNAGTSYNVALQLATDKGVNIRNGGRLVFQVSENDQSVTIPLQVRAISTSGTATLGTIQAVINVAYTWN